MDLERGTGSFTYPWNSARLGADLALRCIICNSDMAMRYIMGFYYVALPVSTLCISDIALPFARHSVNF